ncbi:MAG: hypothetical protein HYX68_25240 [Planctomycetes bacterium]|nr:hypothetical protein [Planctomycetota bacterium]
MSVQSSKLVWRLGAVGLLVCGLAAAATIWQTASQAGAPRLEPRVLAAFKDKQLQVAVGFTMPDTKAISGPVHVELLDADGKTLASLKQTVKDFGPLSTTRFDFDADKADAAKLRLRVTYKKTKTELALSKVLLGKAHETAIKAGTEFHAGSQASIQCSVQGVRTIIDTVPQVGSDVAIYLIGAKKQAQQKPIYEGVTDLTGKVLANFAIPAVEPGQYTLQIVTKSALGEEKLEHQVRIKADGKILLVTDRPIYQPGHLIHLRALALQSFDMKPLGDKEILFEIEDPKGNKVYKRTFKTSEFGIASVDFQLASEVNMGNYNLRAIIGDVRAEKTVQVKRYVLPKFKVAVKTNKTFYLPKETIQVDLQSDYFFGKPVANSKVEISASTFDVAFKEFHKWKGMTDANGHAKLEIQLPDYFVGQPLQAGNAIVKLDIKVLDNADHTEKLVKTYAVSDMPIRVNVISEGGKLVPNMQNRIFVAATYPDGSPAPNVEVKLWHKKGADAQQWMGRGRFGPRGGIPLPPQKVGQKAEQPKEEKLGDPLAVVKTNAAGLAEVKVTPKSDQFRIGSWGTHDVEMLEGKQQRWGAQSVYDLRLEAKDPRGNLARAAVALNSQPLGENVLLRLDKAIYQAGDRVNIDVRSSAGLPTVYVDIVRGGQIMLSKWIEVKDGAAAHALDLPQSIFGSLEIHAYQMLFNGEIIRDSRVVYVQPKNDLKITVTPGKTVHEPGEDGRIRFEVTDQAGKPVAAAIGVIVVDEAVYALQDLQPGLEKVYFTLQEELLKPSAQIKLSPGVTIDNIVRQPVIAAPRQQVAEVLLTAVKLPAPARWNVNPAVQRKRMVEGRLAQIAQTMYHIAFQDATVITFDKDAGRWTFRANILDDMIKKNQIHPTVVDNGFGGKLTFDDMGKLEKDFTAESLAKAITVQRLQQWHWQVQNYASRNQKTLLKNGRWTMPADTFEQAMKIGGIDKRWLVDGFGQPFRLVKKPPMPRKKDIPDVFSQYDIVSVGPDGKLGGKDDLNMTEALAQTNRFGWAGNVWWARTRMMNELRENRRFDVDRLALNRAHQRGGMMPPMAAAPGGFGGPMPGLAQDQAKFAKKAEFAGGGEGKGGGGGGGPGSSPAPITRVREYFPETMLWMPSLITDDKGVANLAVSFADSITTWRLSASANSKAGAIGGATVPLKVFQDFFVDIDLPTHLTQSDEVAFPVAVYNYLKTPQTVKIELQRESWFELLDNQGLVRTLKLQPNEVTSVSFRIRAGKIGWQPLTVKALGSKKSDAVKRVVEVVPNGQKIERVFSDRLKGNISHTLEIPGNAVPDASKLMVRMYPGAMAQVVDGLDGMMRMPGGCFEQTSSSAYPNVLIVDYIKKNRIASPQMLMKAEQYLNIGYQRLLTFERPGGGFDWWGREAPLIWTSAYGLQQFSDMSKVYPIDRAIITRTQGFLMRSREKEGTWSNIGATHGETIASMGNPKLLLTSYVTWSLLESGYDRKQLKVSVDYIRNNLDAAGDNAYILALAANALAAYDPKDDSTLQVCQRLDKLRKEEPQLKVQFFPARGTSLTYGRGDSVSVESTALAVLAMMKTGQFNASVNQSLAYLVKSKHASGTWGTTQATILALKALLAGMGGSDLKDDVLFTIKVNGKTSVRGKIGKKDADVMQAFELKDLKQTGANTVQIEVNGETNLMYQIVSRHFEPWAKKDEPKQPMIEVKVEYDRTKLSTKDLLKAKATLKYHGKTPTYMVMLDLGIAPGFSVDAGDFAEMVGKNKIKKFELTARQVIIYLGDVRPGEELTFEYVLRPRYPLRARTPSSTAYEYNTPGVRAVARPVELTVVDR